MELDREFLFFMNQSEKRLFKRLEIGLEVEFEVDGNPIKATTANISCGGLFLVINPDQVKKDQDIAIHIHLPNRNRPVRVMGQILRREKEESREGVAVKFEGLYNDNILAIDQFIKTRLH
ncbi:MAG: PilZ domain-containing protein [bacterium]